MALSDWPRPPTVSGLPTDNAVNALQSYVSDVQNHMGRLRLDSTEYGVVIGFMLSALDNATKVFDRMCQEPGTSPDIQHDISMFQAAMQSLTAYMENAAIARASTSQLPENSCHQPEDDTHLIASDIHEEADLSSSSTNAPHPTTKSRQKNPSTESLQSKSVKVNVSKQGLAAPGLIGISKDQMRVRLLQDLQDQGIRLPLFVDQMNTEYVSLSTSSTYNAAILRNPTFWNPRLFGHHAYVERPSSGEEVAVDKATKKMRKAEKKARTSAQLCWVEIPDRGFATTVLVDLDKNQIMSLIKQDLEAQQIAVQIRRCKRSRAGKHIRIWTSHHSYVKGLVERWKPAVFGSGAYVRWQKKQDLTGLAVLSTHGQLDDATAGLTAHVQPVGNDAGNSTSHSGGTIIRERETQDVTSEKQANGDTASPAASMSQPQTHDDDDDDTGSSTSALEVSAPTKPETRRMRQVLREVFVELPDHDYAKNKLLIQKTNKIKALVRDDLKNQDIPVRIAQVKPFRSGEPRLRLRTKTPEQAQYLNTPGAWIPAVLGPGAYVVY
ncbi:MAG: hypothetical protein LQ337_002738 [Flavoplaca oasis]|nr:MAG: hypothetical protein LQ337_002738 [Flavoplaca oasis]